MKRIQVLLGVLLLSALCAAAQNIPLLDKVPGHRVTFDYVYGYTSEGKTYDNVASGQMTVQGNAYILKADGLEVISDGKVRWSLDRSAKEALIDAVDGDDIVSNPAAIVASYKEFGKALKVNASGADSLDVSLTMEDGTVGRFKLTRIQFHPEGAAADFTVSRGVLGKDWVVTDLR